MIYRADSIFSRGKSVSPMQMAVLAVFARDGGRGRRGVGPKRAGETHSAHSAAGHAPALLQQTHWDRRNSRVKRCKRSTLPPGSTWRRMLRDARCESRTTASSILMASSGLLLGCCWRRLGQGFGPSRYARLPGLQRFGHSVAARCSGGKHLHPVLNPAGPFIFSASDRSFRSVRRGRRRAVHRACLWLPARMCMRGRLALRGCSGRCALAALRLPLGCAKAVLRLRFGCLRLGCA